MANYFTFVTANKGIAASNADIEELKLLLTAENAICGLEIDEYAARKGELYIYSENGFTAEELSKAALSKLGAIIKAANLTYLEFGFACTCDKMRPGSHSGGSFRVTEEGCIVEPQIVWPETGVVD